MPVSSRSMTSFSCMRAATASFYSICSYCSSLRSCSRISLVTTRSLLSLAPADDWREDGSFFLRRIFVDCTFELRSLQSNAFAWYTPIGFLRVDFCEPITKRRPGEPDPLFLEFFGDTFAGCRTLLFCDFRLLIFLRSWLASDGDFASATNLLIGVTR